MEFLSLILIGCIILGLIVAIRFIKLHDKVRSLEWQMLHLNSLTERITKIEIEIAKLRQTDRRSTQPDESRLKSSDTSSSPLKSPVMEPIVEKARDETTKSFSEREPPKSRTREEWESFVGGKLLNRIGALALIIGLGFFMKYAFDNDWISETVRVLIGVVVGFLCIGLAYRTNKKGFQIFAQGLVGAGIAILYLSVYASFNYYALVPQWVAFVMMSCITALSLLVGIYFDSLAIGILGWTGGFLTPLMLSTGFANEIGLFTYIALLNVGLLAIVFAKHDWQVIEPLALAGTWIMYFAWYFKYYHEPDLIITVFFISVFWLLFFGLDIARLRLLRSAGNAIQHGVAVLNGFLYYIILYGLVNTNHHSWMGGISIVLGGIYFGVFLWLHHSGVATENAAMRYTLSAIVLAVLATSIQFEELTTILIWSIEGVLLLWCGVHWKQRFVYFAATGLFMLSVLKFLATDGALSYSAIEQFNLFFNQRCLTLTVLAAAFGASAWLIRNVEADGKLLTSLFHPAWCIALFVLFTVETNDFFRWKMATQPVEILEQLGFTRILVLAIIWGVLSLPMVWIGLRSNIVYVLTPGLGILALSVSFVAVRGLVFEPIANFQSIFNIRVGAILLVLAGLFIHQWMITPHRKSAQWISTALNIIQIGMVILVLVLLTGETIDYFERQITLTHADHDALWRLNNLRQLSLSAVWLLYSVALMALGFWRSLSNIRIIAFVLFGFTILKIFIYDLSYLETLYRIFSFIGLGLILIAVSYAYQRYKHIIFGTGEQKD
jgi:uncharacterized membrane protein